jgi:hypothetical protein
LLTGLCGRGTVSHVYGRRPPSAACKGHDHELLHQVGGGYANIAMTFGQGHPGGTQPDGPGADARRTSGRARGSFPSCHAAATTCGNGVVEPGETCDAGALGGTSCATFGCTGGMLACNGTCTGYDTNACTGCPPCDHDGVCEAGEDCKRLPRRLCGRDDLGRGVRQRLVRSRQRRGLRLLSRGLRGPAERQANTRWCCGDGGGSGAVPCSDARCTANGRVCTTVPKQPNSYCCGDGLCVNGESCSSCRLDCTLGAELCTGSVDEDCDGSVDCADSQCSTNAACQSTCKPSGLACSTNTECCSRSCVVKGKNAGASEAARRSLTRIAGRAGGMRHFVAPPAADLESGRRFTEVEGRVAGTAPATVGAQPRRREPAVVGALRWGLVTFELLVVAVAAMMFGAAIPRRCGARVSSPSPPRAMPRSAPGSGAAAVASEGVCGRRAGVRHRAVHGHPRILLAARGTRSASCISSTSHWRPWCWARGGRGGWPRWRSSATASSFSSARGSRHRTITADGVSAHLQGMWVAFVSAAMLVTYFVARLTSAIEHRDAEIADVREQAARSERLASLATLAAGAAPRVGLAACHDRRGGR